MSIHKFDLRVERLTDKIYNSKTPVPGLIMGLSGTDSIVSFLLCYKAMEGANKADRLCGIHYIGRDNRKPTWFESHMIEWLKLNCPLAKIEVKYTISGTHDEVSRWHSLFTKADSDEYWVVANVNATEKMLGTYSILAKSASLWPISTIWKTDILNICVGMDVPEIAMEMSRLPDCLCGRDELAASNIELIDNILQYKVDTSKYDPDLLKSMMQWVYDTKQEYDFKQRTPYTI